MNKINDMETRVSQAMRLSGSHGEQLRLLTTYDAQTKLFHFPPVHFAHRQLEERLVGPFGTLYTYTRMYLPKNKGSYWIGFVDLNEGMRLLGKIKCEQGLKPRIGQKTELLVADADRPEAGYAFGLLD